MTSLAVHGATDSFSVPHPKTVSIFGATGSIGQNTLDIIRRHPGRFILDTLSAQNNVNALIELAREFAPRHVVIGNDAHYAALKDALRNTSVSLAAGKDALHEAACRPVDTTIAAIVGSAGLRPTLAALAHSKAVALANKECLVCAGELFMKERERCGTTLLPVDSEHNAIFQVFDNARPDTIDHITLTASGGPFRTRDAASFDSITPKEAVAHPNWEMGAKISVDSATMMNKGLEMIEAYHLFPLEVAQIHILVHPESIIHSMVHYKDGSVLAQMGPPDMRIPIAYSLAWPGRIASGAKPLNLAAIGSLHFEAPDEEKFPALRLAREALQAGGTAATTLNAANEAAIERFLKKEVRFTDIPRIVENTLEQCSIQPLDCLETALACDAEARHIAQTL